MMFSRATLRTTTIALLLAVLWAVLHPSIINAAQSSTHRVLVCTPNGMEWIETSQPSLESFLALQERKTPQQRTSDAVFPWMAPCPFSHAGHVLPLHDGMLRVADPLAHAYVLYLTRWTYTTPIAATGKHLRIPPPRAPPAQV
ncbi:hypothetical protein [Lampropedia aestuarii]|uniref:hypothetical protein n=1 Tax=Lampropedia aestuarii TaxID=2562762 RepID=UPI0010A44A3E|nr:hypothetical protein [Lampropedia aestuarii]MDH5856194.1 hypothetical protein [Lampropedia aestuarii]